MADLSRYTDYKTVLCVNILIFSQGKVLLVKRPLTKKVNPGKYSGIGGKVEPGESYLAAAKRELKEETGLKIANLRPYGVTQSVTPSFNAEWVHVNFVATLPKMVSLPSSEEGDFHWLDPLKVDELDMVSDLKAYAQIMAKNKEAHLLGQFVYDKQDKLIEKNIQVF